MSIEESVACIRSLTEQCAALVWERDELQKQVWRYEKHGVTCQTYGHKVESSCSECNVHKVYTTPPAAPVQEPVAWTSLTEIDWARREPGRAGSFWAIPNDPTKEIALYAAPRQWVGLNFDELPDHEFGNRDFILGARWAEAKLKEKNHG